jgi:hypothetical protein
VEQKTGKGGEKMVKRVVRTISGLGVYIGIGMPHTQRELDADWVECIELDARGNPVRAWGETIVGQPGELGGTTHFDDRWLRR